ncbi:MAG TPA: hypothetical protein VNM72_08640 [Blastocatellia bacterium]|nr:hypothetical protein [Blastocatellia bacterium]
MWFRVLKIIVLIVGWGALQTVRAQCAMCKTGLLNSPEGQALARGFNTGVLFLLSVPFLLVTSVAAMIYIAERRRKRSLPATPPGFARHGRGAMDPSAEHEGYRVGVWGRFAYDRTGESH